MNVLARWGFVFASSLGFLSVLACSSKATPTSGSTCPSGSTLTNASFGQPFMTKYCVTCHSSKLAGSARGGAPAGYDFDLIDSIHTHASEIDAQAAGGPTQVNTTMPPSGGPTDGERKQLGEWLACGAP